MAKRKVVSNFVTIDPSSRSMGVAIWNTEQPAPVGTALFKGKHGEDWSESMLQIGKDLNALLKDGTYYKVFCEQPAYMAGSHQTAASGALVKLTHSAGVAAGICIAHGIYFEYVPINQWKGNLSKDVVNKRIRKILADESLCETFVDDEWDAVGIGLFVKGLF